jgi:DNA adenine methylase
MKQSETKTCVKSRCETCHKEFSTYGYTRHLNRKVPCVYKEPFESALEPTSFERVFPKPLLKWVGGKTQLLDTLLDSFPKEMNHYHEIFLGGGSVLLGLLQEVQEKRVQVGHIHAYDLNEPLIYVYKNIQSRPHELYNALQAWIQAFHECGEGLLNRAPTTLEEAKACKENYYYWTRRCYNQLDAEGKKEINGSALFIFLNKTCFRGVFRMGPHGFNVPYGHYANPEIMNKEHLLQIHQLIQPVLFECCDFTTSLSRVQTNDFVYLDPPYAPENDTSFVGYTEGGFTLEQHKQLFQRIRALDAKIMLSNADVSLVRTHFIEPYTTLSILCKRSIHSKNPAAKAKEVIIKNY